MTAKAVSSSRWSGAMREYGVAFKRALDDAIRDGAQGRSQRRIAAVVDEDRCETRCRRRE
jgi:hypothetical protein